MTQAPVPGAGLPLRRYDGDGDGDGVVTHKELTLVLRSVFSTVQGTLILRCIGYNPTEAELQVSLKVNSTKLPKF